VEGDALVVGDEGARLDWRLRKESAVSSRKPRSALEHAHAHVVVGEDQHAARRKRRIPTDVIGVDVGVDQKANLTVTELAYRGHEVLGMRLELRVDKQHTLFADKYADVRESVGPLNHVHASGDWHDAEFHVVEAVVKLGNYGEWGQSREEENRRDHSNHVYLPS